MEYTTGEGITMRKLIVMLVALGLLTAPAALAHGTFPEKIALPNAFAPEGIEIAHGNTFYVGSVATGAIYTGNLRTGVGQILVPGATPPSTGAATGIEYDRGLLWVAGAALGTANVYNASTGALLHSYQLGTPPATFINDVVVTKKAAFFTDSQQDVIYRVTHSKHGDPGEVTKIALTGDYSHLSGEFNLNGIVATASGKTLIAVQSAAKKLFLIHPVTGVTKAIDTGSYDLANGDGLLLEGRTLFVVQNFSNMIAVFRLSKDLTTATFVQELTDPDFDVPTTIDRAGKRLYVVNARFGTATPDDQHYDIVKVG
jgi:sugar lactone lactonase YvrE